jgi:hypothetical protein
MTYEKLQGAHKVFRIDVPKQALAQGIVAMTPRNAEEAAYEAAALLHAAVEYYEANMIDLRDLLNYVDDVADWLRVVTIEND